MKFHQMAEVFDCMRFDDNSAKQSQFQGRRTGVNLSRSSADYHYRWEANVLRILEVSRDMDRNAMIVAYPETRVLRIAPSLVALQSQHQSAGAAVDAVLA